MLYLKTKVLDVETIKDLIYDGNRAPTSPAALYAKKSINPEVRSTTLKQVDARHFPDISQIMTDTLQQFDSNINPTDYIANEFNYLLYNVGDHFKRHQDVIGQDNPRVFTTITLVDKSADLIGGDLLLWDKNNKVHQINLEVGETVIFHSNMLHQVTPVTQGTRESLVVWVRKRLK